MTMSFPFIYQINVGFFFSLCNCCLFMFKSIGSFIVQIRSTNFGSKKKKSINRGYFSSWIAIFFFFQLFPYSNSTTIPIQAYSTLWIDLSTLQSEDAEEQILFQFYIFFGVKDCFFLGQTFRSFFNFVRWVLFKLFST